MPFTDCSLRNAHPGPTQLSSLFFPLLPAASFPSHRPGLVTGVGQTRLRVCPAETQQGKQHPLSEGTLGLGGVSRSRCECLVESLYVCVSVCVCESVCETLCMNVYVSLSESACGCVYFCVCMCESACV